MNSDLLFPDADTPKPSGDPLASVPNTTPVPVGKRHPWTSRVAARMAAPKAGSDAAAVLAFIASRGEHGATDEETLAATGVRATTPRRIGLRDRGLVCDSGRTRLSERGCPSIVWVAVEHAAGGGA